MTLHVREFTCIRRLKQGRRGDTRGQGGGSGLGGQPACQAQDKNYARHSELSQVTVAHCPCTANLNIDP